VGQASAGLPARGIIRNIFSRQLLGRFPVKHNGTPMELLGKGVTRHDGVPVELLNRSVIRHTGIPRALLGRFVIRHTALRDLNARVEICHWADLGGVFITRHSTSLDLPALFWARQAYRLWTNRRYVNGVVELTETLIGNAIFEYVIEGVMQDIQSYLINAGLDYSDWTDIVLTPKLIRRATTYGTVAALYARRAKTFATRVIPTMAPVTLTAIGDEERAMNHWREKMDKALEFYVTSQGGDVMITSTDDEEPVFSMEDTPPELTDFTPWYQWLMRRTQ